MKTETSKSEMKGERWAITINSTEKNDRLRGYYECFSLNQQKLW